MEENVQPVGSRTSRKRVRNPEMWKRAREKAERYAPKNLPVFPTCQHFDGKYKCRTLTGSPGTDIRKFFQTFYALKSKKEQDAFLLKFCKVKNVKRRRPRVGIRTPNKYHTRLFIRKSHTLRLIPVCQKTFLNILRITVHRIRYVSRRFQESGFISERRGGDRTSHKYLPKRQAVKRFIESFKCLESHYCRSSVERKYLDSSLNIKKMWKQYCSQTTPELSVKQSYFRHIFNTCYNIGFGSPRTDVCSRCTELQTKIQSEKDANKKSTLMIEKRVHLLKAKAFYRILREQKEGMITLSFDCQKNQILPKVQDQIAYYSRQFYIYNFAVVRSTPEKRLNQDTVNLYCWTETEYKKGANEIASAVYHRLNQLDLTGIKTIRLVADGCGAQNKNSIMMGMCSMWLINAPLNVHRIELVFPVPGHSFLPADRVFGNIEREIKKKEVILSPEEYKQVFNNYGKVVNFENMDLNWKSALDTVMKPPGSWHFQFAACKRFYIKRNSRNNQVFISGEVNYNSTFTPFKSVLKRGKSFKDVIPAPIEKGQVTIKQDKITDVDNLLKKHFGMEWRSRNDLKYYKDICDKDVCDGQVTEARQDQSREEDEVEVCEPCLPEEGLMV